MRLCSIVFYRRYPPTLVRKLQYVRQMWVTKSHSLRHLVAPDSGVDPLVGYSNIVIYIQMTLNTSHSISYLSAEWWIFLPSQQKHFFIQRKMGF